MGQRPLERLVAAADADEAGAAAALAEATRRRLPLAWFAPALDTDQAAPLALDEGQRSRISAAMAAGLGVVPLRDVDEGCVVAALAADDRHAHAELTRLLGRPPILQAVDRTTFEALYRARYGSPVDAPERVVVAFAGRSRVTDPTPNQRPLDRPAPAPSARSAIPVDRSSGEFVLDGSDPSLSWRSLVHAPRRTTNARVTELPRASVGAHEDLGAVLATVRAADSLDGLVEGLLAGTLLHARQAFVFRVRTRTMVGLDSAGSSLGAVAVRRIELPLSVGSTAQRVLETGLAHQGPLGTHAADQVLRVSVGSRGGRTSMHSVAVDGRPILLLLADDLRTADVGHERLGLLAHAASLGLRRLLHERA